jgi:hypothetical protein
VRCCVNPSHLELVTHRTNILRGFGPTAIGARQTHCIRGHALVGTHIRITREGYRRCRICNSLAVREWKRIHHN